ncbi:MAG TPA: glycosyltransferase [Candidatus Binatia bacterium]|nr:glycosyltransferase [Candidatus Binatia bacterium]
MASILIVSHVGPGTSDVPLLLARAFDRLGQRAQVFAVDEDLSSRERVLDALGAHRDHPGAMAAFNRRLGRRIAQYPPALLFLFGSNWNVLPATLDAARRRGTTVAIWETNHRFAEPHQAESMRRYDWYFDYDTHFLPVARAAGIAHVELLPACADPEEHRPLVLGPDEEERYGADVGFVGSPYPERIAFAEALGAWRLKLWGGGWAALADPGLRVVPRAAMAEPVYGVKKTKIYRASKINLNVQGTHMVNGENFRLFEVAACDAFCLTTPKPDLARWFRLGEDLTTFEDVPTLRRRVAEALASPALRAERAARAREIVLRAHTYDHRAAQILDAVGLRSRPPLSAEATVA